MDKSVRIGLLGFGQIGSGCYSILSAKKNALLKETGIHFEIAKIAVRNRRKKRLVNAPASLLTTDAWSIVKDPSVDIVVELIGGTKEAYRLVKEAILRGKHVVTANKAMLAEHGDEIFKLAYQKKKWVLFEASVGGGIPVIKVLRESLVANKVDSIHSIINGTCNYILTRMSEEQTDFDAALKCAQQKGYAEADPTFDIEGIDSQHKLAILVRFAFGGSVDYKSISCEGISSIRSEDIAFAEEFGYIIKLLAIAKKTESGIEARVQPTLLPKTHILSNVHGSFNAVLMHGDETDDILLYGRGAGSHPTASAVVSDLVDIVKKDAGRLSIPLEAPAFRRKLKIKNISSILSRYYLRFHITDKPGVLSAISKILGAHGISISDCVQKVRREGRVVPLILLTHAAHEKDMRNAMQKISKLNVVREKPQVIRIEDDE